MTTGYCNILILIISYSILQPIQSRVNTEKCFALSWTKDRNIYSNPTIRILKLVILELYSHMKSVYALRFY